VSGAAREPRVTPRVVVLAAPSGGGKTTIARELRTRLPALFGYSVSATTRKARPGEQDGEAYHFLTRDEFLRRREAGEFLAWAPYAGEVHGTLRHEVERVAAVEPRRKRSCGSGSTSRRRRSKRLGASSRRSTTGCW